MRKEIAAALAGLLVLAGSARAGSPETIVRKCIAPDGAVTYQSARCEVGHEAAGSWSAPSSENRLSAAEIEARARRRKADAAYLRELAGRYRGRGSRGAANPTEDACERARQARADARRDAHLDYDARDKLDNAVMRACY